MSEGVMDKKPKPARESTMIRLQADLKRALEQAAEDDHRSLSSFVEVVLAQRLKELGYLK